MQITVSVKGELVRKGLQDLSAEVPKVGRQQIRAAMERIKRRMEEYPEERAGQRYKRTGRFFRSWGIDPAGEGYVLKNTAKDPRSGREYGRFVVGGARGDGQAWMHAGRWQLLRDVVDEEVEKLPGEIEELIQTVARSKGL